MVKGINKQIIEIKCTNNELFEKAMLFVSPSPAGLGKRRLERQAKRYVDELCSENRPEPSRFDRIMGRTLSVIACLAVFAVGSGLVIRLF